MTDNAPTAGDGRGAGETVELGEHRRWNHTTSDPVGTPTARFASVDVNMARAHTAKLSNEQRGAYESARAELMFAVARFETAEGKGVRPASFGRFDPSQRPAWRWKRPPTLIPWNLPDLYARPDAPVVIAEGETATESAAAMYPQHVATCAHGGAHQPHLTHWGHLARRDVLILPDDDAASCEKWALQLWRILRDLGCRVDVSDPLPKLGVDT